MRLEQRHQETKTLTHGYTVRHSHREVLDTGFGVQVLIFSHTGRYMEIIEEEIETEVRKDRVTCQSRRERHEQIYQLEYFQAAEKRPKE